MHARVPHPSLAPDVEAERRWSGGPSLLEGIGKLPEFLQDIGWIRLRTEDPAGLAWFYQVALGLDLLSEPLYLGTRLHLGGTAALELLPKGARRRPPKDRVEITDSWALRVYDYIGLKARLAVYGVHKVNTVEMPGGWLDTCVDPEGHLFGFQERKTADPAVPDTGQPEDADARRMWESR
jgi:hypothetical protein